MTVVLSSQAVEARHTPSPWAYLWRDTHASPLQNPHTAPTEVTAFTAAPELPILVKQDDPVIKGQHVGFVGVPNVEGGDPHPHFYICYTETLNANPDHWPDWTPLRKAGQHQANDPTGLRAAELRIQALVRQDYLDPLQFFVDNHEAA